jgi:hypothetical protein
MARGKVNSCISGGGGVSCDKTEAALSLMSEQLVVQLFPLDSLAYTLHPLMEREQSD